MLNHVSFSEGGVPLVIVHGLFGSARNWRVLQKRISENRHVVAVDLRNHGSSFWSADNSYEALAADLGEVIDAYGGTADVLGHSMGGKAAMTLALLYPRKLRQLIVADIAPVAYSHTQVAHIAAMQAVDMAQVSRRSEADKQLAAHIESTALRAFFLQSIELSETGARWQLNLDALKAEMRKIMAFPDLAGRFEGKTLFLRGGDSDYVLPEMEAGICQKFPHASFESLTGAGHWLHAEKPREFQQAIEAFLPLR